MNGPADLECRLRAGIANIREELNMLAMVGAVPMWGSLIGRLEDLEIELFGDRTSPEAEK